ncbi:MAG TPA: hypothetical protein PK323_13550 [Bacteroidia bacterium]|nr:hypothetical protein [Bacteroidia bacterium]
MKKSYLIVLVFLMTCSLLLAQAPSKFNYQATVRNNTGAILVNQAINFKFSILSGSNSGSIVFSESNLVNTNSNGLVNINVGSGNIISGNINNIDWASNLYFLKIEMDVNGGNNFVNMGTQQMVSVPYALDAKVAEKANDLKLPYANTNFETNTNFSLTNSNTAKVMELKRNSSSGIQPVLDIDNLSNDINATTFRVTSSAGTSARFDAGSNGTAASFNAPGGNAIWVQTGNVGIGTSFPQQRLEVNGGIRIGNSIIQAPGSLRYNGNNFEGYNGTSWVQLNGGGSPDNWGTQSVVTNSTLTGNGTIGNPLDLASQGANNGDVLKWNGISWVPGVDETNPSASDWAPIGGGNIANTNSGAVFIGNANPSGKLNVSNGIYPDGITSSSNDGTGSGIYGANTNAGVGVLGENFGLGTGVGVKGYSIHGVGGLFSSDDGKALITEQGNIGFGVASPQEKVEINGAIVIGNTIAATPSNGTIRYTPTNGFEIRHANTWSAIKNFWNSNNGIDAYNLNSGNVGIGTSTPGAKLEVAGQVKITGGIPGNGKVLTSDATGLATWQTPSSGTTYSAGSGINIAGNVISNTGDLSNTNEIQALSLTGNILSLSNGGGSITLPSSGTNYTAGNGINISGSVISNAGDLSSSNELQTISKSGNTISLSNGGGSVTDADAQTLSLSGNTLSITGGNSVTLPSGGGGGTNYWTLDANNHIKPNNSGNVLIGADANGSSGANLEVRKDAVFGKVASFSNIGSSYTTIVDVVDNGTSGGPAAGVGSVGNAAIRASSIYGDALFASSDSRAMYIKGGNAFYPTIKIEQNIGATNPSIDMDGQIMIRGGNPGPGKVLTSDANGLATWESAGGSTSYSAGTGINISGSTISAQAANPLWNANKLNNINLSSSIPTNGQVLQYNGTSWAPVTPASSSNIYDNISEHFQTGVSAAQANSTTPEVDIPGLSKTINLTGNAKVLINAQIAMLASCIACGDHKAALELNVDGNPYVRSFYSLDNGECTQGTINKFVTLGAGTHTIKMRIIWLEGAQVTVGNVNGCSSANDVYMDAMVINQ